ncbi:MAG: TIGR00725 family protein [bacterium]
MQHKIIGVIGGSDCTAETERLAEEVGALIAQKNAVLICGGLGGVMAAACRGAKKHGGTTIGILPGKDKTQANPFVDIAIVTGMSDARNVIIIRSSQAVIAIDGSYGTLSEISFCLKFKVPVIGLQTWEVDPGIVRAENARDAVNLAFDAAC